MSTLDREPRTFGGKNDPLHEPRFDPGMTRPNQPQKMAPKLPRGADMMKPPARMPVKR
jgi:hypothetical protein